MAQLGFFDADKRLAALSAKGDPLEAIAGLVPWESFRAEIEAVVLTPEAARKSTAGRKPIDAIVMLRMLVLQSLYNLSDEQAEYLRALGLAPLTIGENAHHFVKACPIKSKLFQVKRRGCSALLVDLAHPWNGSLRARSLVGIPEPAS